MSWQRNYVVLNTGVRIRYALLGRDDTDTGSYHVRFRDPNGRRVLRTTGQSKKPQAIEAAHRIILEEYGQTAPTAERDELGGCEGEAQRGDGGRRQAARARSRATSRRSTS